MLETLTVRDESDVRRLADHADARGIARHLVVHASSRDAVGRPVLEALARQAGLRSLTLDLRGAGPEAGVEPSALEPLADAPALRSLELVGAPWTLDDASLWVAFPYLERLAWSGVPPTLALKGRNWSKCRIRTMDVELWRFNAAAATCLAAVPTLLHLGLRLRGPYRRSMLERLVRSGSLRTVVLDRLPGDRPGTGPAGALASPNRSGGPRLLYEPR